MKKTTRDNDEKDIMGNRVRQTTPSLCAQRRALRREAELQPVPARLLESAPHTATRWTDTR